MHRMENNMQYSYIKDNIAQIEQNIQNVCQKTGVNRSDINLMAVSKTQSVEKMLVAKNCGLNLFGENRVQEFKGKADFFNQNDITCHLIGTLQSNKIKFLPSLTNYIQSVGSENIVFEIQKQYEKANKTAEVLLQINIANEDTKSGINKGEILNMAKIIENLQNVKLRGLMCIPPPIEVCSKNVLQNYFKEMYYYFGELKTQYANEITTLSMGMSDDYELAIENKSTLIRLGSAIFGQRQY